MKKANRFKEVSGVFFLFIGLFILISLISYNHSDPSLFSYTKRLPLNYGGSIGANLSEILLQFFGAPAFLISALFIFLAINLFKGAKGIQFGANVLWILICLASLSTLLGLQFGRFSFGGTKLHLGGFLGSFLSPKLASVLNVWGASLLMLAVFLVALIYATPFSLIKAAAFTQKASLFLLGNVWRLVKYSFNIIKSYEEKRKTEKLLETNLPKNIEPKHKLPIIAPLESHKEIRKESKKDTIEETTSKELIKPLKQKPEPIVKRTNAVYDLPLLSFLNAPEKNRKDYDRERLLENSKTLESKLTDFGIEGTVEAVRPGPVITMYEFKPGPGVKISQIAALADDLSLALSAQSVRIVAPIPGKSVVGIEIPNDHREKVMLREILENDDFQDDQSGIAVAIGKDIGGTPVVADLARMPHLLIAGAPGAGKSVFINSLICSLLYKFTPNDMRLLMVDPKQLELNLYEDIPHLLLPIVDDPKKASTALKWAVNEMERRYKIMAQAGVRNIAGFNEKLSKEGHEKLAKLLCPKTEDGMPESHSISHLFEHDEAGQPFIEKLPVILVIIDEFADLMMVAPKDIETSVARLAQKARAAGIHLVIATQRPSVDVITGLIKANLPSRISFQVASKVDSRTIIDTAGAEKLLGQGDMLFIPPGLSRLVRLHGAFVTEEEIEKICSHWKEQGQPIYQEEILIEPDEAGRDDLDGAGDELYQQAITIVRELGQASASMLQRRLKVGYNRAARMIEAMEAQGVVGPADGAKPREVLY